MGLVYICHYLPTFVICLEIYAKCMRLYGRFRGHMEAHSGKLTNRHETSAILDAVSVING